MRRFIQDNGKWLQVLDVQNTLDKAIDRAGKNQSKETGLDELERQMK